MWQIREEQTTALKQAALKEFEDYMVAHLTDFIPPLAKVLGDEGLRLIIRLGIERAKPYGFTSRACLQLYIETMIILGAEFDTDPQYPWAQEILTHANGPDEMVRGAWLCDRVAEYRAQVDGADNEHVSVALENAQKEEFAGPPLSSPGFSEQVKQRLRGIFPQKCEYVGDQALDGLIRRGREEAKTYGVTSDAGVMFLVGLMFTVGHGMTRDPHLPWIGRTLAQGEFPDPNRRAERLYSKAMTYLNASLASQA